jgi:predicted nucleic acid-binding protein
MFVFDASMLILIAKVDLLEAFLGDIQMKVAVPPEVVKECCGGRKTLDGLAIQKALDGKRIRLIKAEDTGALARLQADFNMGRGEAEAIVLVLQEKARILGVDDKIGIQACRLLGIRFTTAVAILLRSREKRLIDSADAMERLTALGRFGRYSKAILDDARARLEKTE